MKPVRSLVFVPIVFAPMAAMLLQAYPACQVSLGAEKPPAPADESISLRGPALQQGIGQKPRIGKQQSGQKPATQQRLTPPSGRSSMISQRLVPPPQPATVSSPLGGPPKDVQLRPAAGAPDSTAIGSPVSKHGFDAGSNNMPGQSVEDVNFDAIVSNQQGPVDSDSITVKKPPMQALISVRKEVDPFTLDASSTRSMSLEEAARISLANNLDVHISDVQEQIKKANLYSSMGKFLPNANLGYQYIYLKGNPRLPVLGSAHIDTPFIIAHAGYKYYLFRGGSVLYTALQNKNNHKAAVHAQHATMRDSLQQAARLYYDLLLQESLLAIRVTAVQTSTSNLDLTRNLQQGGLATYLDAYQAETQLSQDRQNLIDQQIARRNAAISLAEFLNIDQGADVAVTPSMISMKPLVSEKMVPGRLIQTAIENRPELKQYEELRLAAKKSTIINAAKLLPTFDTSGNIYGIGQSLSNSTTTVTTPITLGGGSVTESRRLGPLWTIGYNLAWNLEGLGVVDAMNVKAAKLQARQAQLEETKELNTVLKEVRSSYLNTLSTGTKIQETISRLRSATEELRLARLRYESGLGKYIDILRAQQDYTDALIQKARAIISFNTAEVDLLRATGLISVSTLTSNKPLVY